MTVWYKQGVYGDLTIPARKGLGRVAKLNEPNDLSVTSIRDGNHMAGSLHYDGNAFDIRPIPFSKKQIKDVLGPNFDVVIHSSHIHIEHDPK